MTASMDFFRLGALLEDCRYWANPIDGVPPHKALLDAAGVAAAVFGATSFQVCAAMRSMHARS